LSDEVASYLRQGIMAGEYASGQPVQAEAIGEALSVSATPVREALQALKAEGFLDLAPRRGFSVAPLTGRDIRDLFEAHALIAGELSARATERATEADIAELDRLHGQLMTSAQLDDNEALERKNHEFHRYIYRLSGSDRLRWSLGVFAKYVPRMFYSQIEGWPQTTADDHSAVIAAIKAGDADAARTAMSTHIRNAGELLAEHYDRRTNAEAE